MKSSKTHFRHALFLSFLIFFFSLTIKSQIQFEQVLPPPPAPQIIPDFEGAEFSSIAFADVDGDSDKDVLITGANNSNQRIAKLYTNDGSGNFSEVLVTPFDAVWRSSIAFADVDGDGHKDVLITGEII